MSQEHPSNNYEAEVREEVSSIIPPPWLELYYKENPHIQKMSEEPIEGFEERMRKETRAAIKSENAKRLEAGKAPVTLIGIHAATENDILSSEMLYRITESAKDVGVRRDIIKLANKKDKLNQNAVLRAVEKIRNADGFVITTHTKRGALNSFYTALIEALEEEDLTGKVVGFAQTYDNPTEDAQVGPAILAQRFFESKGCIILPYTFMYAHTAGKDEAWVQEDIAGNGVRLARGIERLTRSHLVNLLDDPEKLRIRKTGAGPERTTNPEWTRLMERVEMINGERKKLGQKELNVLFVLGGEAPTTVEKTDAKTGEIKHVSGGKGARISYVLSKNFEFLGLKTETLHLAAMDDKIETTKGNPNTNLAEVTEGKEENTKDALMLEAYKKMIQADMIIFSTPVRWFNVSSHLQKFIERMTPLEASGFLLEGKAFGTVVTFGEAGGSEVQSHLDHFALHNGMMAIPLGGIKRHLSMDLDQKRESPVFDIRELAARGTGLLVDYLCADGNTVNKIDFKAIRHPLEEIVEPGD